MPLKRQKTDLSLFVKTHCMPNPAPPNAMISEFPSAPVASPLDNTDQKTLLGDSIVKYELHYIRGNPCYNGKKFFQNGARKEVSFIPFDESEDKKVRAIYTYSTNICDERVLRPWFVSYCKDIYQHIICYDRFHNFLEDWLPIWNKTNSVKDLYGLPHLKIQTQISKLLKSVDNIHKSELLHLSLFDISNYVVIDNNWYIINVGGKLNPSNKPQMIIQDFQDFGYMLGKDVLSDTSWRERNDFLKTFAKIPNNDIVSSNRLALILLDNAFTKSSYDRLQMFSKIHHSLMGNRSTSKMLNEAVAKQEFKCCFTNGRWDMVRMGNVLGQVFRYSNSNYNGRQIRSLLKFCRNVFEHYQHVGGDVKVIEKEIRQLWPGFLETLLHYYY